MEYQFIVNPVTNRKVRIDTPLGKRIIKGYAQTGGVADCEPSYSWGGPNWVLHNNSGWGTTCRRKDDGTNWYDEEADWAGEDMTPRDREESVKSGEIEDLSEDYGERKDRLEDEEAEAKRRLKRAERVAARAAKAERDAARAAKAERDAARAAKAERDAARAAKAERAAARATNEEKAAEREAKAQRRLKRAERQRLRDKLSTKQVQKLK